MSAALELGLAGLERAAASRSVEIALLVPVAQRLARAAGDRGITVSDLRAAVQMRPGEGREHSFLGVVMRKAGLVATGEWRRSERPESHGNLHRVFRAP